MNHRARVLVAAVVLTGWSLSTVFAQSTTMLTTATVRASCRVTVEPARPDDAANPRVSVACGRTSLRTLRVSTDRGEDLADASVVDRSAMAWRELQFVVPQPVATLASAAPSSLPAPERAADVLVTLDF